MRNTFGKSTMVLKVYDENLCKCEICNEQSVSFVVSQYYVNFLFLPVFPLRKIVSIYCDKCKNVSTDITSKQGAKFREQTRTPIYLYTWIFIILFFIGVAIIKYFFDT
jgi:hypothetical protein